MKRCWGVGRQGREAADNLKQTTGDIVDVSRESRLVCVHCSGNEEKVCELTRQKAFTERTSQGSEPTLVRLATAILNNVEQDVYGRLRIVLGLAIALEGSHALISQCSYRKHKVKADAQDGHAERHAFPSRMSGNGSLPRSFGLTVKVERVWLVLRLVGRTANCAQKRGALVSDLK